MSVQSDSLSPNPFEVLAMACQYQSRQDRFLRKDILPSTISDDPELSEAFNAALTEASKISEIRTERNWRSAEEWASIFEAQTKSQTSSPYSKSSRKNKRLKRNEDIALHCVCQTKYDPRKFMIACDKCNGWFHGTCVNVEEGDGIWFEKWFCFDCQENGYEIELKKSCQVCTDRPESNKWKPYCSKKCLQRDTSNE